MCVCVCVCVCEPTFSTQKPSVCVCVLSRTSPAADVAGALAWWPAVEMEAEGEMRKGRCWLSTLPVDGDEAHTAARGATRVSFGSGGQWGEAAGVWGERGGQRGLRVARKQTGKPLSSPPSPPPPPHPSNAPPPTSTSGEPKDTGLSPTTTIPPFRDDTRIAQALVGASYPGVCVTPGSSPR